MKKTLFILALALVSAGCAKETAQNETAEKVEPVRTMTLQSRTIQRELTLSGNLQGYQTVNIAPSLTGKIEHIYVEVGDRKLKGQDLVRMDQTQYNQAKLTMSNLEIEKQRMDALIKTGSVSQQAYDQLKLNYDQAKEQLDFLGTHTYVKAPFTGVISAKNYEDGELFAGQPIVIITEVDRLKTLIAVPESYIPQVKEGMKLTLKSEIYPDREFPAFIEVVYPTVDAATHTFQCKVQIPNKEGLLRPGMYVTSTLGLGNANVIAVPYQSVEKLVGADDRFVFLYVDGRAKRVPVELGQRFGEDIEIIAPEIVDGAEYVYQGQHRLVDGCKLEIISDQENEPAEAN
ncbi:MAG: efflux RND transporter periplasmic adaptor subunit [Paludibacteraceae bacterium]|nr:efflux RND transporter periplasmic adaptor subunit [Paludibacteraceae bacterium]